MLVHPTVQADHRQQPALGEVRIAQALVDRVRVAQHLAERAVPRGTDAKLLG